MFAPERIRIIKGILSDKKHINVSDLSTILDVSEVTVRRDLEKLEKENFLTRTHGGAILNSGQEEEEDSHELQDDPFYEQRLEISGIAAHLVDDNDIIILSSGPTNLCIARKIAGKKNITVLTNDLNIAAELSVNANNKVIMPGGDLDPSSMSLVGKFAEENLRNFFVEKAFLEVEGVSMQRGYTVQSIEKASILKEMLSITKQSIIVSLYNCYDKIAFSQVCPITRANTVITNPKIPDEYKSYLFNNNIKLFTAFNAYEGGI